MRRLENPSASYRFIPVEAGVTIAPPVAREDVSMVQPLAAGSVSARINVKFTAKTAVCVGQNTDDGAIEPVQVGGRYCLPGTSLRGMLRSVVETITFAHLGRINSARHHSVRDFRGIQSSDVHEIQSSDIRGGWIRFEEKKWRFYPAKGRYSGPCTPIADRDFVLVPITDLIEKTGGTLHDEWLSKFSVAEKYRALGDAGLPARQSVVFNIHSDPPRNRTAVPHVSLTKDPDHPFDSLKFQNSFIICGGPFSAEGQGQNPRRHEVLMKGPVDDGYDIPDGWMRVFHRMHSEPNRNGGQPRGSWRSWLRAFKWVDAGPVRGFSDIRNEECIHPHMAKNIPGIPVFWKGSPEDLETAATKSPGQQSFWFDLSRVIRVPYRYSVGDVAARLYEDSQSYQVPRLSDENGWDFARALFGEVDGANIDPGSGEVEPRADGTKQEDAQKGRVAVGFAWAPDKTKLQPDTLTGVFSQPRESFWPFYLRSRDNPGSAVSYEDPNAIPAGRKRYVVRPSALPQKDWPQGNDNAATQTKIRFLPVGTVFSGEIRAHNLHPVEFGALVWTLTLGEVTGKRCHMVGRARAMGQGAIHPKIEINTPGLFNVKEPPADPTEIEPWIDLFETWMKEQLTSLGILRPSEPFRRHPAIVGLRAYTDPGVGEALQGRLRTGTLDGDFRKWNETKNAALKGGEEISCPFSEPDTTEN